jgi:hypothetical protein
VALATSVFAPAAVARHRGEGSRVRSAEDAASTRVVTRNRVIADENAPSMWAVTRKAVNVHEDAASMWAVTRNAVNVDESPASMRAGTRRVSRHHETWVLESAANLDAFVEPCGIVRGNAARSSKS